MTLVTLTETVDKLEDALNEFVEEYEEAMKGSDSGIIEHYFGTFYKEAVNYFTSD